MLSTPLTVLLCRSKHDNIKLDSNIKKHGFNTLFVDLIDHCSLTIPNIDAQSSIVITSKLAAQILSNNRVQIKQCFVVGQRSADILQNAGYNVVLVTDNAQAMYDYIAHQQEKFIYLSGNHITQEMPPNTTRIIVYETSYATSLNKEIKIAIKNHKISYAMLFSCKAAKTLYNLLEEAGIIHEAQSITYLGTSEKVTDIFAKHGFHIRSVKKFRNIEDMINLMISKDPNIT